MKLVTILGRRVLLESKASCRAYSQRMQLLPASCYLHFKTPPPESKASCRVYLPWMQLRPTSCYLHFKKSPPFGPTRGNKTNIRSCDLQQVQWAGSLYHAQASKPLPPSLYQKPLAEITNLKTFLTLVNYFFTKENRKATAFGLIILVAVKFLNVYMASYFSLAIDLTIKDFHHLESFLSVSDITSFERGVFTTPFAVLIGFGVARILQSVCNEYGAHTFFRVILRITRSVSRKAFSHIHDLDLQLHLSQETDALKRVIDRGSDAINSVLFSTSSALVPTLVEVCMVTYFMGKNLGAPFAWIASVSAAAQIYFTFVLAQWINNNWKAMNEADVRVIVRSISSLIDDEKAKYFNNEAYELEKYDKLFERLEDAPDKKLRAIALLRSVRLTIFIAALIACFYRLVVDDTMTIGRLFLVSALLFQLLLPIKSLPDYGETLQSLGDVRSLFQLLEVHSYIETTKRTRKAK